MTENTSSETEETEEEETPGPKVTDTDFYVPQEVTAQRSGEVGDHGYPFLDVVEREAAEVRRARAEDREPDFDNLPAYAGTPLLTRRAIDPDGLLPEGAEPNQTLPVVSGEFELDDDGENVDEEKSYLTTKVSTKEAPKKATAKKVATKSTNGNK